MILREPEIYYAAVCLVMVCSSLFCALVRYFHLCRPFDEHEEYFYPARKLITFVYVHHSAVDFCLDGRRCTL